MCYLFAMLVSVAGNANAQAQRFAGTWANKASNTRSLSTLQISVVGIDVTVRAWGRCLPTDCFWGAASGTLYAPAIRGNLELTACALEAGFLSHNIETRTVFTPLVDGTLRVDLFTTYKDGSGRNSVYDAAVFVRVTSTSVSP